MWSIVLLIVQQLFVFVSFKKEFVWQCVCISILTDDFVNMSCYLLSLGYGYIDNH